MKHISENTSENAAHTHNSDSTGLPCVLRFVPTKVRVPFA